MNMPPEKISTHEIRILDRPELLLRRLQFLTWLLVNIPIRKRGFDEGRKN